MQPEWLECLGAARDRAKAGFALEPTSAAALASSKTISGDCAKPGTWVLGTGTHVKWAEGLTRLFEPLPEPPPEFDELERVLETGAGASAPNVAQGL